MKKKIIGVITIMKIIIAYNKFIMKRNLYYLCSQSDFILALPWLLIERDKFFLTECMHTKRFGLKTKSLHFRIGTKKINNKSKNIWHPQEQILFFQKLYLISRWAIIALHSFFSIFLIMYKMDIIVFIFRKGSEVVCSCLQVFNCFNCLDWLLTKARVYSLLWYVIT